MGCGAGLIPSLGLPCNSGSKDVLVPAVRLKAVVGCPFAKPDLKV